MHAYRAKLVYAGSLSIVCLVQLFCLAAAPATRPAPFDPETFDFKSLLHDPPSNESTAHLQEIAEILRLQRQRTAAQESQCRADQSASVFVFSRVLGASFNPAELPQTDELMHEVSDLAISISHAAQKQWNRPSPSSADPRVHPCVKNDGNGAYPSAQAVRGMVLATLLARIYTEQRGRVMALGRELGEEDVIAGRSYPSDVEAGQTLAAEIVHRLLANESFLDRLDQAREECQD